MEYASLVWYPLYMTQYMVPDKIHRKFLKYLSYKLNGIYPSRGIPMDSLLIRHNMTSLSARRDVNCANFLVKLISNKVDCSYILSTIGFNVPRLSSRHVNTFYIPPSRTNVFHHSPSRTMCNCFNKLIVEDIFMSHR
ncbi:hypothetical protein Zmor_006148 [Zophobas morio]|uniref:Uncharacterized protein n=1 Tax=Zophobas morio TaxID=2755281 RepID=A0AA38MN34_9CUCU|nr:hypothetical protein Zmor_006148 [Zophobas morio]